MSDTLTRNPNLELRPHHRLLAEQAQRPWTGRAPTECPGFADDGVLHSLPTPHLKSCSRQQVLDYFDNSWTLTEVLFSGLHDRQAFVSPPWHRLRHPLIFYFCHPATLYVNKLRLAGLLEPVNLEFETLFQAGVDEMSWDDLAHCEIEWPAVDAVVDYRREVYRRVKLLISGHPALAEGHPQITSADPLWALFMAFEHERIHLETSSVLIRELPVEWVRRPSGWPRNHPSAERPSASRPVEDVDFPRNDFISVPAGRAQLGKPPDWPSYGWDNEYGHRVAEVAPFHVQRYLVSNGEFLEFVRDEGYLERSLWSADGWGWRQFRNARWPAFWVASGPDGLHHYRLRTVFETITMPWSWPVEVNFHEAQAYLAWRARRDDARYHLLSEAKHRRLRPEPASSVDGRGPELMNLQLSHGSAGPVDAFASNPSGVHDVGGNVWQWCEDHFGGFEGFKVHPLYDDFSAPCFDGKHQLILGGSFASTGDEASVWARFHFRPHFHQHAGFRLVATREAAPDDAARIGTTSGEPSNPYEREDALRDYLSFHYGGCEHGPREAFDFPQRCAQVVTRFCASHGITAGRVLDVGCAVGRSSFELARDFAHVVGVDLSESFIRCAKVLQETGHLDYYRRDEGDLGELVRAEIDAGIDRDRVQFRWADACALPPDLVGFDAVLGANLLCRLPSPRAFLERLAGPRGLVRPGGMLVLTTPCSWMVSFTPREAWLGGFRREGDPVSTLDGLRAALGSQFELLAQEDAPLLIREHRRKYQYIVAQLTVWRRIES